MNQPRKIFRRKISAGNNQVNALKKIGIGPAVQLRLDNIGD
jgi:hypothetical protein